MKRFLSVLLLMGGLVAAGGANAAVSLGTFSTADCGSTYSPSVSTLSGAVGDTFQLASTGGVCTYSVSNSAVLQMSPSGGNFAPGYPLTVTILAAGTATIGQTGSPSITVTVTSPTPPTPPPAPIPTLSEWAQIMMMLAMIATAGLYGWRMKQR